MNDKEAKRFYDSALWKHKREDILIRDHFECQDCRARLANASKTGEDLKGWRAHVQKATQVHHILELKDHPELALEDSNLVSLCRMDHNIRHGRQPFYLVPKKRKKKITTERW